MTNTDIGPTVDPSTPEGQKIRARKRALMAERDTAVARQDWAAMNEITKRIAKLPALMVPSAS